MGSWRGHGNGCLGWKSGHYEFSLNRNLAMNEGSVREGCFACLSPWLACVHRCQGELVWLVSQARRGRGTCFWAVVTMETAVSAGYVYKGRAATWSRKSRPGITNVPDTWDHLAPGPWAGQRDEIWVSSTAVRKPWEGCLWSQLTVLGRIIRVWDL